MTLRILLAEDHQIVREGLRSLLERSNGYEVVGETGNGLDVLALVGELRPDVVVADIVMPGLNGIEVTRRIRKRNPQTRVVVLSMHASEAFVLEALAAGASGYVLKDTTATELVRAIDEAAAGRRYLSPPLSDRAVEAYMGRSRDSRRADRYGALTTREREVLQLVAEGLTSLAIAERFGVSRRTVESHRANLMRKLGVPTTAALVRLVAERGLLPELGVASRRRKPESA